VANDLGITIDKVTASYEGVIADQQTAWVNQKIDEAVRELLSIIPDIPTRIAAGKLSVELVTDKVVAAVLRVVRNPTGYDQESEGDYSYKLRPTVASGDIWYPSKDLIQLGWVNADKERTPRTVFSRSSRGFGFPS
jgi:hypothetical protein